jgi:tetratricopeptide (TPR) repeat protein
MIELLLNAENALALGLLDQAERTFRRVLEADPRNGIAAVGLSRVALERGDDATALALAQAALAIDPDNATARRMIDRLEEVARYRAAAAAAGGTGDPGDPGAVAVVAPSLVPPGTTTAAPSVRMSASAPSVPAPERPGLIRRLLRRS